MYVGSLIGVPGMSPFDHFISLRDVHFQIVLHISDVSGAVIHFTKDHLCSKMLRQRFKTTKPVPYKVNMSPEEWFLLGF